jgi:hypothetical protein
MGEIASFGQLHHCPNCSSMDCDSIVRSCSSEFPSKISVGILVHVDDDAASVSHVRPIYESSVLKSSLFCF